MLFPACLLTFLSIAIPVTSSTSPKTTGQIELNVGYGIGIPGGAAAKKQELTAYRFAELTEGTYQGKNAVLFQKDFLGEPGSLKPLTIDVGFRFANGWAPAVRLLYARNQGKEGCKECTDYLFTSTLQISRIWKPKPFEALVSFGLGYEKARMESNEWLDSSHGGRGRVKDFYELSGLISDIRGILRVGTENVKAGAYVSTSIGAYQWFRTPTIRQLAYQEKLLIGPDLEWNDSSKHYPRKSLHRPQVHTWDEIGVLFTIAIPVGSQPL